MNYSITDVLLIIFSSVGLFGNVNVILAVLRRSDLCTKKGLLVLVLTVSHIICNVSEIISLVLMYRYREMTCRQCFQYNIAYSFAISFQSIMYLMISVDLLLSIVIPLKHMIWRKYRYVAILTFIPLICSILATILNYIFVPEDVIPACLFLLTTDPSVYRALGSIHILVNDLTLFIFIFSTVSATRKMRSVRGTRGSDRSSYKQRRKKLFRSTFFMIFIYIISWMTATILFRIFFHDIRQHSDERGLTLQGYYYFIVCTIAMPSYCQTYFITFIRSSRFRQAYKEHINVLTCGLVFRGIFEKNQLSRRSNHRSST